MIGTFYLLASLKSDYGHEYTIFPAIMGWQGQVALHCHSATALRLSRKNEMQQFKSRGPGGWGVEIMRKPRSYRSPL